VKSLALMLVLVGLLTPGAPALAAICTVDTVPAATLLLPYFEVDLSDCYGGRDTLFSINNVGPRGRIGPGVAKPIGAAPGDAAAVLAHFVIWSDLSVPVLDFNVYLTGYDVQSFNLCDILAAGILPQTASAGQDPGDTISPKGAFSQDVDFASCSGQLPTPKLPPLFLAHLQNALTGKFSALLGGCAGLDYGDNVARGYITVDTVNNCTLRFPGDLGYFATGGTGDATNQNLLWGDYFYVDRNANLADGYTMVAIKADAADPETSVPGQYTFYGRYVNWTAADNREPLAANFAARFLNGGAFSGGTSFAVWRDSKVSQGAFKCGTTPAWYPLGQEQIVIFDEQEHPQVPATFPVSPQPPSQGILPFPAEAQRTVVGGVSFPVPYSFGWLFLNLNTTVTAAGSVPPEDPAADQAWVTLRMVAAGLYSVGFDAIKLDSACTANHARVGGP